MHRVLGLLVVLCSAAVLLLVGESCGSGSENICNCTPDRPESSDFRHAEKHVPLPPMAPIETTVSAMIAWPKISVTDSSPRTGRELQLYHIANTYVQAVWLYPGDCDIHVEIADTTSKTAPRVIVETPVDSEYCSARQQFASALASHGYKIVPGIAQEITPALPAEVVGLAFEDFEHNRGSQYVATTWELHPAVVTVH